MKTMIKKVFCLTFLSLVLMSFNCCCDDDEKVAFSYELKCSPNLLQYVTPVVTYLDENLTERTIELGKSDFREDSSTDTSVNGQTITSLVYTKTVQVSHFNVRGEMKVEYRPNENIVFEDDSYNVFRHDLSCEIRVEGHNLYVLDDIENISVIVNAGYSGQEAKAYIENLATTPDKISVYVDADGSVHKN